MRKELRSQCALKAEAPFNLKWLDVDGDPISVDCPREWDEAIRLYIYNQETELLLHGGWGRGRGGAGVQQWLLCLCACCLRSLPMFVPAYVRQCDMTSDHCTGSLL